MRRFLLLFALPVGITGPVAIGSAEDAKATSFLFWPITAEPEAEKSFLAARAKDIRAGLRPEFRSFLGRVATSERQHVRVWALTRLLEAGDATYFQELSKEMVEHVRDTALRRDSRGVQPFTAAATGLPQAIHPSSPFFPMLEKTVRSQPECEVSAALYVVWCYNTLPEQRDLIYEIARKVKTPISLQNPTADPWNDPRFWILTDWALAWGEPQDFERIPSLMENSGARREFEKIAATVTKVPGFFACRNEVESRDLAAGALSQLAERGQMDRFVHLDFSRVRVKEQPKPPRYPTEAKLRGLMCNLQIQLRVDTQGKVCGARTLPGPFLAFFAPAAVEFASRWTFDPATVNGEPVNARFLLSMPFRLR